MLSKVVALALVAAANAQKDLSGTDAQVGACVQTQDRSNRFCSRMACRNIGATSADECMRGGANSCCQWTGPVSPPPRPVDPLPPAPPHPIDPMPPAPPSFAGNAIPLDCVSWNDGCNTCGVEQGQTTMCTMMACFRQATPYCMAFADGTTCRDPDCSAAHGAASGGGASGACNDDGDCSSGFCRPSTMQWDGAKECVDFAPAGSTCGGMMPPNMQTRCEPGLECVNTMAMMMDGEHATQTLHYPSRRLPQLAAV